MPVYEYRCKKCGETREALKPISERNEPITGPCVQRPLSRIEINAGLRDQDRAQCRFDRIISATPTTFRFNDHSGFKGLDKRVNKK